MKLFFILSFAFIGLAACSTGPAEVEPQPQPSQSHAYTPPQAQYGPVKAIKPLASKDTSVATPTLKPMSDDQCHSAGLQFLIGKPRTDIPVPLEPGSRRVVCSSCVTTYEFRADRQTITFDSDTGLITSIKCG